MEYIQLVLSNFFVWLRSFVLDSWHLASMVSVV